MTTWLSNSLG